MLVAIAFAALKFQAPGPVLPPLCSPTFQAAVLAVEESLEKQDFAKAREQLKMLPKPSIAVSWEDQKVPAAFRAQFRKAGEAAMAMWKSRILSLSITPNPSGPVRISFEPVLANRPGTNLPAAHVSFWNEPPSTPRLDFVIGLKRGAPLKTTEELDIFDDVAYAIGAYLGAADGVYETYTMAPIDLPRTNRAAISQTEASTVRRNLQIVRELELAVENKKAMTPTKADLFIDPLTIDSEPSIQGDRVEFHVQLSNRGNGPLTFSMWPDCGCTVVTDPGTVAPQSSRLVSFAVDTTSFISDITKHVAIYTNDPVKPVQVVSLNVRVKPRYRLLTPMGDTVDVPATGLNYPIYLIPASGTNLDPVSVTLTGPIDGKVTFTPWQGVLPDPELNEGPKMRKGFKVVVAIKGNIGAGRNQGTVQIYTANSQFPDIAYSFNAQKGIIALPDDLPMGEVGRVPKTARFLLTRPGPPFKILGITTNSPNLSATVDPKTGPNTYTIMVRYDGNAHAGELLAAIKIKTSDAKQPVIDVPVRANVQ